MHGCLEPSPFLSAGRVRGLPHLSCPNLAERVGFEPTVSFPTHDFQSCRFGRSRTPPASRHASLKRPRTLGPGSRRAWCRARRSGLRNGAPQTGSGPDGSSPQRTALCAVGNLTVAPGTKRPRGLGYVPSVTDAISRPLHRAPNRAFFCMGVSDVPFREAHLRFSRSTGPLHRPARLAHSTGPLDRLTIQHLRGIPQPQRAQLRAWRPTSVLMAWRGPVTA